VTARNFTSNPHYAKPLHIRAAFRVWLLWRNNPLLRAMATALPLAVALWALLILALIAL
jgi:hypothetical protein